MEEYTTRRCSKCGVEKPLTEFYRSKSQPLGHCYQCKSCAYTPRPRTKTPRLLPGDFAACTKCGQTKPIEGFYPSSTSPSGYTTYCKVCENARARKWKSENKAQIKAYEKENQDRLRKLRYDWVARNIDRVRAMRRLNGKTPRARLRVRLRVHQRRVGKGAPVTPVQIEELQQRQTRCYYCKKPFNSKRKSTLDHVIPLAKGGAHDISNIVLACWPCNNKKSAKIVRLI